MHVNHLKTGGKRSLREIQHVLQEPSKANKKAKPHALATCPSLGNKENMGEPCTPEPYTPLVQALPSRAYKSPKQIGFLEQLYNRLRRQQAKGKPLHVEDHVKTIQDALSKELKASKQSIQSWSNKYWYEQFLEIKNKTYPEKLRQLKEDFAKVFEDAAFKKLIQDGVSQRQAWWKDIRKPCPSKANFIAELKNSLCELVGIQEGGTVEDKSPYVNDLLGATVGFLKRNIYDNRENLYVCSFGAVHWYALLRQQDANPEAFNTAQEKLVDQIIQGLKTEGEQVIDNAEESLSHLDLLLDLLNPHKRLEADCALG